MNIDAYLHQVHSANARLKDVVDCVKEVVSEGIEKKIEEIRRVILFDKKLATAHVWNVEKFVEEESKAVFQQGRRVHEMVKEVENSLQVKEELKCLFELFCSSLYTFLVLKTMSIKLSLTSPQHLFDTFVEMNDGSFIGDPFNSFSLCEKTMLH